MLKVGDEQQLALASSLQMYVFLPLLMALTELFVMLQLTSTVVPCARARFSCP